MKSGFDGQSFFDMEHPVIENGEEKGVFNMQAGDGPAWFLLDTKREIRPFIFQTRTGYEFNQIDNRPVMTLTSIASNQGMGDDNMANDDADFLKMTVQLLGIEGQYTPAQILTKLQKLVQDNPVIEEEEVSAIASLMRDLNTERYQTQTARQEAKVTAAITSGHMPPHMRGWMTRLCKQDEEAFDELFGNTKPIINIVPEELWDRKNLASSGDSINGGMAADQVAAQLGIDANKIR